MKTPKPDKSDIEELLSFLPIFSAEEFYEIISDKSYWIDYEYDISETYEMLRDHDLISNADSVIRILNRLSVLCRDM